MFSEYKHPLVSFYRNPKNCIHGRCVNDFAFEDFLQWSDDKLEEKHDYIQWVFPLDVPSKCAVTQAPPITKEEIEMFRKSSKLRKLQRQAFNRMLKFYGFKRIFGFLFRRRNFKERSRNWIDMRGGLNHNYLRLTRIITSLKLLGNESEGEMLQQFLLWLYEEKGIPFPPKTIEFWRAL